MKRFLLNQLEKNFPKCEKQMEYRTVITMICNSRTWVTAGSFRASRLQ